MPKFLTFWGCFSASCLLSASSFAQNSLFLEPNTYRLDGYDLTGGLLDLLEAAQEVPETGLGDRLVGGEDGHAIQGRGGVSLRGQMTANDLEFLKTTWRGGVSKLAKYRDEFRIASAFE